MSENTPPLKASWFVYYLRCADNSLYAGITTDLTRRLNEHNTCNKIGAKYTRVRRPVKLAYAEKQENRQLASKREYQLKKLTKGKKEALVSNFDQTTFIKILKN
jgi:putative endonuclease